MLKKTKGVCVIVEENLECIDGNFKVTLVLEKKEYERIKGISTKLGMKPASWMKHVMLSKLGIEML